MVAISLITLLVGAALIAKDALTARFLGVREAVDAFSAAQAFVLFLATVFGNSLASASVPHIARVRLGRGSKAESRFVFALLITALLCLLLMAAFFVLILPIYARVVGSGFSGLARQQLEDLGLVLMPVFIASSLSAQLTGALNYRGAFVVPALVPVLVPMSACVAFLIWQEQSSVQLLAMSVVIGTSLNFLALLFVWLRTAKPLRLEILGFRSELFEVGKGYGTLVLGAVLMGLTVPVDQAMAGWLEPGSVATLTYGGAMPILVAGFGARVVGGLTLVRFSDKLAGGRIYAARCELNRYILMALSFSLVPAFGLVALSEPLVHLVFVHGQFFPADAEAVAKVQRMFALQIPFFTAAVVAVRMLSALNKNRLVLYVAAANLVLNAVFNWFLMRLIGVAGIALSTSIVCVFSFIACWFLASRQLAAMAPLRSADERCRIAGA